VVWYAPDRQKIYVKRTTSMFYRSHRGVNLSREVATSVAGGGTMMIIPTGIIYSHMLISASLIQVFKTK
jgi:hypothetical protein